MRLKERRAQMMDILETLNSLTWFSMDAAWMLGWKEISLVMIAPTFLSAVALCFLERTKSVTFINVAILSWICMNALWMCSELFLKENFLPLARFFLVTGIIFIGLAYKSSGDLSGTLSQFRRFRLKNYFLSKKS